MKFLEQVLNALNRLAGMYKGILTEFSEMRQRITQLKEDQDGANSQFIEEPEVLSESDKQVGKFGILYDSYVPDTNPRCSLTMLQR